MINKIKYNFLIGLITFSAFCLEYVYLWNQKLTLTRIFIVLIIIRTFFTLTVNNQKYFIKDTTYSIIRIGFFLISYKFIVDFYHGYTALECMYESLKDLIPLILLINFEQYDVSFRKIFTYIILAYVVQIIFGVTQLFDPTFTLADILNSVPVFSASSDKSTDYILRSNRIVGTFNIGVSYALILSIFSIIFISKLIYSNRCKKIYLSIFFLTYILMLFSGTRGAMYGGILAIIISSIILDRSIIKYHIKYVIILCLVILMYYQVIPELPFLDRLNRVADATTASKIGSYLSLLDTYASGLYLFGVTQDEYIEILSRCYIYTSSLYSINTIPTPYHNLAIRYLVDYGVIGLLIFLYLNIFILKKIFLKHNDELRFILFCSYTFVIIFSMVNNTQLFYTIFFWIMLSIGEEKNITNKVRL